MIKRFLLPLAVAALTAGIASATPVTGSFTISASTGSYVTGTTTTGFVDGGTAATATGLDFLPYGNTAAPGSTGTFGQPGSAMLSLATGSFSAYNNTLLSLSDIYFGTNKAGQMVANPYTSNPFLVIGAYVFDFGDATVGRGLTYINIAGNGLFQDTRDGSFTPATFSISTSSTAGNSASTSFSFTGNAGSAAVAPTPEPSSLALLGTGVLGVAGVLRRRFAKA